MDPTLAPEGIRLIAQQGVFAVLFLFACAAAGFLFIRLQNAQTNCMKLVQEGEKLREQLQEKRLQEIRETVNILHIGSQTNQKLADSLAEITTSLNSIGQLVAQQNRDAVSSMEYWKGRLANIDTYLADPITKRLDDLRARMEEIQKINYPHIKGK